MTVLVTGGAGFIGRHVVAALVAQGREVRVLDVAPWPDAPVEAVQASVLDGGRVTEAMRGVEGVCHLAAHAGLWARDRRVFARANVEGARAVARAAARAGARLVNVSSATTLVVGGRAERTVSEGERAAWLLGPYPRSKRAGEAAVFATPGLEAVSLLPTLPVGPGDFSRTAPTRLLTELRRGGPPAILETWLDLVDVRDLAATIARALERGRAGERYLVGGHGLWLSELARAVDRAVGRGARARPRVPYGVALAAAVASEAAARMTGREPQATLTGVRIAGRVRRFDSGRAREELVHRVRPLEETLRDALDALG